MFLSDDKPVQEEDWVVCQHPECRERRRASKVSDHSCCVNWEVHTLTLSIASALAVLPQIKMRSAAAISMTSRIVHNLKVLL